jgi:hypothetical protein
MPKENSGAKSQEPEPAPRASGADLAAENAALRKRIAEMESAQTQLDADEKLIVAKMSKGLRREQARAVIHRQREFDKANEGKIKN